MFLEIMLKRYILTPLLDKMRNKELLNKLKGFNDFGKERNYLKVRNGRLEDIKRNSQLKI